MKKEVEVCDKCDKNISVGKCAFCFADVCKNCGYNMKFYVHDNFHAGICFVSIAENKFFNGEEPLVCQECREQLMNQNFKVFNDNGFLINFIDLIKKFLVAKAI